MLGLILLASEVFLLPGTMVPGLIGTAIIVASLLMAMIGFHPGIPWSSLQRYVGRAMTNLSISIVGTFILGWILARFLPETTSFQRLMLLSSENKSEGFHASAGKTHELLGAQGIAITDLRPSGTAVFGERRVDVVTKGEYLGKDTPIVVAETHGNRIVVESVKKQAAS